MFTHKIISKEFENGVLVLGVEFTDGTKTVIETVKPQDEHGFKHWLKARLTSLNSLTELEKVRINTTVDVSEPAPVDKRTQTEKDRDEWLVKYNKWIKIKTTLIDTGVIPSNNPQVVTFLDDVKSGFKPAYINFI